MICSERKDDGFHTSIDCYDLDWNRHSENIRATSHVSIASKALPRPECSDKIIDTARILSKPFPEVRVDLYVVNNKVYFGELTFTSLGGMMNYYTPKYLEEMGEVVKLKIGTMKGQNVLIILLVLAAFSADTFQVKAQDIQWELVFSDEFDQPNGSRPDPAKWNCHRRGAATWSRWISDMPEVAYIKSGRLICRAIPNTIAPNDTAQMLTGAINTKDKFSIKYGKVEVRMRTNVKQGNFPAIWTGVQSDVRLPYAEIDIMESFGQKVEATHTVHSQYTQDNRQHGEKNNFRIPINIKKWHIYGMEWNEKQIIWTIDGKVTGIYNKSTDPDKLAKGQWTFDVPLYFILNQSVGREGSNNPPNIRTTYETQFDWIRVYKRKV